ncbi:hypothetical protein ACVWXL_006392 [Bradyrhizobium sp. GM22.5]
MVHDSPDNPDDARVRKPVRGNAPDVPPQETEAAPPDLDPATANGDDEDDARLPDILEESGTVGEEPLATGHEAIERAVRLAPTSPGVYRMLNANADVLYVGKAKNVKKRLSNYARQSAPQPARILRMIAATVTVEIISTHTETEALLLEANLIKQLRPRFNVQLRDDKSFPYILITGDHWAPQILKHRGAQTRPGRYFGPFASAGAVNRTITALQRAFLIRSCTDSFFESRSRPCLLYQIRRCAGPCTREIDFPGYTTLVREASDFLSGRSHAVKQELAAEMEKASGELEFESAALYRDRLAALSAIQSQQGINPRTVEEADVFAIHQEGGFSCVEVFFFRTGQNWGNRAYFPRAEKTYTPEEVLGSFLAQFYDDKPPPRNILLSHEIEESELLANALSIKAGRKVEVSMPKRGEKKELVTHALTNGARGPGPQARGHRDAEPPVGRHGHDPEPDACAEADRGLRQQPHPGHQRSRRHDRRRPGRFCEKPVPQVQHQVGGPDARRRLRDDARGARTPFQALDQSTRGQCGQSQGRRLPAMARSRDHRWRPRPAQRGPGHLCKSRPDPGGADVGGQGAGPGCRPRDPVHAGARGDQAGAARPRALFHPAAAGRGAPFRHRLAPQAAQEGHPRGRLAGDSWHRSVTQTCLAASFRNPEGDRTGLDHRSR